ncbi:hypothetical protein OC835_005379 [Tilletia horrida]|nr:hypothetical protein OC835_005379 [Tilletia horrida]
MKPYYLVAFTLALVSLASAAPPIDPSTSAAANPALASAPAAVPGPVSASDATNEQQLDQLRKCTSSCTQQALPHADCGADKDPGCVCKSQTFLDQVTQCLKQNCGDPRHQPVGAICQANLPPGTPPPLPANGNLPTDPSNKYGIAENPLDPIVKNGSLIGGSGGDPVTKPVTGAVGGGGGGATTPVVMPDPSAQGTAGTGTGTGTETGTGAAGGTAPTLGPQQPASPGLKHVSAAARSVAPLGLLFSLPLLLAPLFV